jgi:hypothetical protein
VGVCPICKSPADVGRESIGDFTQYDCPRCGPYQITGSAKAMLPARLESDEAKARARLSHAVRVMGDAMPGDDWPEINSVNLDELVRKPLPSIERQTINLLRWAAKELGDDQLGVVELPDENYLAGIVGTIDASRADDLMSLARDEGMIELVPNNCISVTRMGWKAIEPVIATEEVKPKVAEAEKTSDVPKVVKAHCNRCRGDRNAFVRATHTVSGSDGEVSWSDTYDVLECCGCGDMNVRHEHWFSEWDSIEQDSLGNMYMQHGVKTTYWPPPMKRQKPEWSGDISDDVLRTLFDELYVGLASDLLVLSTIGARTLFDRASFLQVGDPPGGFAGKMQAMLDAGQISANEKEILEAMTDAGNASAHRGYSPTFEQLTSIVNILENYIERTYVLAEAADALRKSTPARPPSDKASEDVAVARDHSVAKSP